MALQVQSNVKIITSGTIPTVWDGTKGLRVGEMAFGLISSDGKYHIYGNSQGTVVDLVASGGGGGTPIEGVPTLDAVLTQGNTSTKTIVLGTGVKTSTYSGENITIADTTTGAEKSVIVSLAAGFVDNNKPVLSANADRVIAEADKATMRNTLGVYGKTEVYSKTEVDNAINAQVGSAFDYKGTVDTKNDLPTGGDIKSGDIYNVTDENKTYVYNGTEWEELANAIDLSGYYTKTEVDTKIAEINTAQDTVIADTTTLKTDAETMRADITTANGKITALETRMTTAEGNITQLTADLEGLTVDLVVVEI